MKYHFYLGILLLALACEKTDPAPIPFPVDPIPVDSAYGYPPRVLFNCLGLDTVKYDYPPIPGWTKTLIPSNLNTPAYGAIYFVDEMNGFLLQYNGIINKTTDGGQTWIKVLNQPNTVFLKMSFSSDEHGVVAFTNSDQSTRAYFLTTYDSGNTWTQDPNMGTNFDFVNQMQFLSPDLGFISATLQSTFSSNLYKTIDSAKTWTPVLDQNLPYFNGFFRFQSRDTGYFAANGALVRTTDGGQQWASTEIPFYGATDVRSFDDSFAVVYGSDGVAVTRSGGNRWEKISQRPTSLGRFFADGSAVLFQQIKACNTVSDGNTYAFVTTNDFGATWHVGPLTKTFWFVDNYAFVNERCIFHLGSDGKLYKWTRL